MKNIKSIYRLCIATLVLIVAHNSYAQQAGNNITGTYTGTWQYDNNNERFIVKIWQDGSMYKGHYKKIQLNNGIEGNVIYNSRLSDNMGEYYPNFALSTNYSNEYGLSGFVEDNIASGNTYNPRSGNLQMKMTTVVPANGCNGCVVKASWKVKSAGGMHYGTPPPFSIPLDIELTKVSNTITLD